MAITTNPIRAIMAQRIPLFPFKPGSTVGMFTVVDYGPKQERAEARLIGALDDHGIKVVRREVSCSFIRGGREQVRSLLNEAQNIGVSTFFMTGGQYNLSVLSAFEYATLHSLYVQARPVSFVFFEEALFRLNHIKLCREEYTDYLGSLHFGSEYSVDHGIPQKFGNFDPRQGPPLSVTAFSKMEILKAGALEPPQSSGVSALYLSRDIPDLLHGSNIPLTERKNIIRDVVLASEEKRCMVHSSLQLVSFMIGLANEGLINDKEQAAAVRETVLDLLITPERHPKYRTLSTILGTVYNCRDDYEKRRDKITDQQSLCKYLDWLR